MLGQNISKLTLSQHPSFDSTRWMIYLLELAVWLDYKSKREGKFFISRFILIFQRLGNSISVRILNILHDFKTKYCPDTTWERFLILSPVRDSPTAKSSCDVVQSVQGMSQQCETLQWCFTQPGKQMKDSEWSECSIMLHKFQQQVTMIYLIFKTHSTEMGADCATFGAYKTISCDCHGTHPGLGMTIQSNCSITDKQWKRDNMKKHMYVPDSLGLLLLTKQRTPRKSLL